MSGTAIVTVTGICTILTAIPIITISIITGHGTVGTTLIVRG
jgi:hypothetical protein